MKKRVIIIGGGVAGMQTALRLAGGRRAYMGTVEGWPGFDEVLAQLKEDGCGQALLVPFMLVAGDHARNDLAGDEDDSWATKLKAAGFKVETNLKGLGQIAGARAILVRHAREAADDLTKEPKKQ